MIVMKIRILSKQPSSLFKIAESIVDAPYLTGNSRLKSPEGNPDENMNTGNN